MITQVYHKKNELLEVSFFKDKECTEAFYFKYAKNLYIDGLNGDITPLIKLNAYDFRIFTPYLPNDYRNTKTLDDITPNLSKYIPTDNAVLFLSEEDFNQYKDMFPTYYSLWFENGIPEIDDIEFRDLMNEFLSYKKITIFLPHGTQSELQKAKEILKELREKYGVEKVNLCVLHWFLFPTTESCCRKMLIQNLGFNKIITTNSTGILKPENSTERLQVIDVKEIFEEYLNENNLI